MELPKEFEGTIGFYWHLEYEFMHASANSLYDEDSEYVKLGSLDISVDFDLSYDEAVNKVVENLIKEKTNIQAKAQSDLNKLDEKINSLLAINYDGGE